MPEFTDHDRRRLDEIHSIVTNGLKSNVSKLTEQYERVVTLLDYMQTDEWHRESCPIIRERRGRRKSWDWLLAIGVSATAILSSLITTLFLIFGG